MYFNDKKHFLLFLNSLGPEIGIGSQATVYHDKKANLVYKIYHQFFDNCEPDECIIYDKDEIMRFSNIKNNTFIWASDVIYVEGQIVGSISKYVNSKNLYQIDPLRINLDSFTTGIIKVQKDIKTISDNGIITYDVAYNILYGNRKFNVIDYDEYSYSEKSSDELLQINMNNFNYEIMLFLIDNYFDDFVNNYRYLKNIYGKNNIDIIDFINVFRILLSEYVGNDIQYLYNAKGCLNKKKTENYKYQRMLIKR